jgi:hypothetical protein
MKKQTAHNLLEVKVLIKEAFARGDEEKFNGTVWTSHNGEKICISKIELTEYELVLPDMSSITCEV